MARRGDCAAEYGGFDFGEKPRIFVGGAPDHHAVDAVQVAQDFPELRNPAVYDYRQFGKLGLEAVDDLVAKRRNFPVLLGAQPFQPRLAGVDDEDAAAAFGDDLHEAAEIVP